MRLVVAVSLIFAVTCSGRCQPDDTDEPPDTEVPEDTDDTDVVDTDTRDDTDPGDTDTDPPPPDADGDGSPDDVDCDDADPDVHPGAEDACGDGIDQDCSGAPDDGEAVLDWFTDGDGDGWGDPATAVSSCPAPAGLVARGGDCADADPAVHPGALEDCADGVDSDCDGDDGRDPSRVPTDILWSSADAAITFTGDMFQSIAAAGVGDVNGDGYDDVLVGRPAETNAADYSGAVYLFLGPISGALTEADAWAVRTGEAGWDSAGHAVVGLGDLDGDGYDDVAVSAPADVGPGGAGRVYVLHGPIASGTASLSLADAVWTGSGTESLGEGVARAGDQDGDGCDDLLISSRGTSYAGAAYVVSGCGSGGPVSSPIASWSGATLPSGIGGVSGPADYDGDGLPDLWLFGTSRMTDVGAVYAFSSPAGASPDLTMLGSGPQMYFGKGLGAGDIDGDGLADLVVGEPGNDSSPELSYGAAYLYRSPVSGSGPGDAQQTILGYSLYDYYGSEAAILGDVDGDGLSDVVITGWGVDGAATRSGVAWIYKGPMNCVDEPDDADWIFRGPDASYTTGAAPAGDLDNDGLADLLLWSRSTLYVVLGRSL